ncbi:MAG TPA: hypothetical protein VIT44_19130 [Cyclobacteriaceae bacterium]
MKTITRSILFVSIAALLSLSSCKDDDDPSTKSKTDLLTQNTWKYKGVLPANDLNAQFLGILYKDSEYTFKKDKTYSSILFTIPITGKWEFAEDETQLILDKGEQEELTFKVKTLDDSNLELTSIDSNQTTAITLQFVKK